MNSILIGKIVNLHGIKGEVKLYPYTDDLDNLTKLKEIYLDSKLEKRYIVKKLRIQKNMLLLQIENIDSANDVEKLLNKDIYIEKIDISNIEDTYYVEDLIGMKVIKEDESVIGKITYVFNTGANDVYEIKKEDGKLIYIPAIKDVIKKVDIDNKIMYIEMMKGLE